MDPSRRSFLRFLLSTPLAAVVDYEQLLWVPKPIIVVPSLSIAALNNAMERILPGVVDEFFRNDPYLTYLNDRSVRRIRAPYIQENFHFPVKLPAGRRVQ